MALSVGTASNSGNQANSSGFSFSHTTGANTVGFAVVITGFDTSATDSAISSVTWNSQNLTQNAGGRYRVGSDFQDVWYLSAPAKSTTTNITVTPGGACTDIQATAINLDDSTAVGIKYDSFDTGTGTGSASAIVNPAATGSIEVGGGVAVGGTPASLSISAGTEVAGSEVDMGSQTASVGTASASGGSATITWSYTGVTVTALGVTFVSDYAPTVSLSTPTDSATGVSTTPDLVFTGTDSNGDDVRYDVQVDTTNTFNSQLGSEITADSYSEANQESGLAISSNDLYQGMGQYFTGNGGTLSKSKFYLQKVNSPTGSIYSKIYSYTGTPNSNAAPTGAALATSDAYDVSTIGTSYGLVSFTFSGANRITLTNGTGYIVTVEFTGGDSSNDVNVGRDATSPTDDGNYSRLSSGTWSGLSSADLPFYVYTQEQVPLLDKISGTDAGFSGTPDNSDPFASGQAVTYTVQSGDTLSNNTTYYWRVRGKDPTGSNTYGSWSTTRSFTTTAGGGGGGPAPATGFMTTNTHFWGT